MWIKILYVSQGDRAGPEKRHLARHHFPEPGILKQVAQRATIARLSDPI